MDKIQAVKELEENKCFSDKKWLGNEESLLK